VSTLTERGLVLAARALPAAAGGLITYARGAASCQIAATFGRTAFEVATASEVRIEHSDRDFNFPAAALVLDDVQSEPEKGDRITAAAGGVYEVLAPGREPVWEPCDPAGTLIRVHAKKVGN